MDLGVENKLILLAVAMKYKCQNNTFDKENLILLQE